MARLYRTNIVKWKMDIICSAEEEGHEWARRWSQNALTPSALYEYYKNRKAYYEKVMKDKSRAEKQALIDLANHYHIISNPARFKPRKACLNYLSRMC